MTKIFNCFIIFLLCSTISMASIELLNNGTRTSINTDGSNSYFLDGNYGFGYENPLTKVAVNGTMNATNVTTTTLCLNGVCSSVWISNTTQDFFNNVVMNGTVVSIESDPLAPHNGTNANYNLLCVNCTSAVKTDALYVKGTINLTGDLLTGVNWVFPQNGGNIYSGTSKIFRFAGTGVDDGGNTRGFTLRVGAGAADQPPYQFAGDTVTGLFSPGFGNVSMTAGGIEVFRANSNNQTITYGNAVFGANLTLKGVGVTPDKYLTNQTDATFTTLSVSKTGNLTTNISGVIYVNSSNSTYPVVGIGTQNPEFNFEINGNSNALGSRVGMTIRNTNTGGNARVGLNYYFAGTQALGLTASTDWVQFTAGSPLAFRAIP